MNTFAYIHMTKYIKINDLDQQSSIRVGYELKKQAAELSSMASFILKCSDMGGKEIAPHLTIFRD